MASILIIEDSAEIRTLIRDILKRDGHDIKEATNGEEGVAQFRENTIDLVMTDLFMPRKGGIETISDLQEIKPGVKIIAMTSHGSIENYDFLRVATALGAVRTIEKPFDIHTLKKLVAEVISL